jgi:hypothetical protein
MANLTVTSPTTARCSIDHREYQILFSREPVTVPEPRIPTPPPIVAEGTTAVAAEPPPPLLAPPPLALVGMRCVQHRNVQATQQCTACGAYVCDTCDFAFPDGTHLCPACATKPVADLTPKQRNAMIWSYVCAAGATVGFVGGMAMARTAVKNRDQSSLQVIGVVFLFFVLLPAVIGLSVGLSSRDRNRSATWSLRGAIIWNSAMLAIFLLLTIVGNLK